METEPFAGKLYQSRRAEVYGPPGDWTVETLRSALLYAHSAFDVPLYARVDSTWRGSRDEDGAHRATVTLAWEESQE